MIMIDDNWLSQRGIGIEALAVEDWDMLLDKVQDEMELRTGGLIIADLNDEQLTEFEKITDQDARTAWLAEHVPDFESVPLRQKTRSANKSRPLTIKSALLLAGARTRG